MSTIGVALLASLLTSATPPTGASAPIDVLVVAGPAAAPEPGPAPEPAPSPEPDIVEPEPEPGPALDEDEPTPLPELEDEPDEEEEPGEEDGDLTLDDIFGTADDHVNVREGPTDDADGSAPGGLGLRGRRQMWENLDTRVRVISSAYYDVHRTEKRQFGRNENRLEFSFTYTPNKHLQIVGNLKAVFFGVAQAQELDDLATQQMLTPFHFESDAAYIALIDVLPHLDIKIGRQVLVWGTADKFNPTNNISPDDLEDRPLFTEPIGNQMIVVDYAPLANKLWFQGVYVPIFFPALLPPSASAALRDPRAPVPFARQSDQRKLEAAQNVFATNPMLVPDGVKLAAVNLMKDVEGGEPPDHAYPYVADLMAFCALGANGFAGANGIDRLEAVEQRLSSALDAGSGLDAELVLLMLHASLLHPGLIDEYGIAAEADD